MTKSEVNALAQYIKGRIETETAGHVMLYWQNHWPQIKLLHQQLKKLKPTKPAPTPPSSIMLDDKVITCFDVEAYEFDFKKILEVGITTHSNNETSTEHYIIKEHKQILNDTYCVSNKDEFDFGTSEYVNTRTAIRLVKDKLLKSDIIVGHSLKSDFRFLKLSYSELSAELIDTAHWSRFFNDGQNMKLEKLAEKFDIELATPHNAGNDAHVTMLTFLAMNNHIRAMV